MDQETKNYILLIALDNLVNTYSDALEILQLTQEEREFMPQVINSAQEISNEMSNTKIKKPQWNKETKA